jgi:SpoIIAA-like
MLERLQELPAGIDGVKAVGRVSKDDYERVFDPLVAGARREGRRIRLLYQVGPEFEGFTPGAAWEDAKLGLASLRLFDGLAVVTDVGWIRESTRLIGFVMPCPVRVFGNDQLAEAVEWLRSLPEGPAVSHRLLPERGVLVVEVRQALRAQDFDALAATADNWIEAHGALQGIVIHARAFPGWENLAGLIRHVRFVRDHQRRVRRAALASDSRLADLAPRLAEHFAQAEVRRFGYDALDAAIAWAGGADVKAGEPAAQPAGG